jgi:hypothetical protein
VCCGVVLVYDVVYSMVCGVVLVYDVVYSMVCGVVWCVVWHVL